MARLYWRVKKNGKWTWEAFGSLNSEPSFKTESGWTYSKDSKKEEEE